MTQLKNKIKLYDILFEYKSVDSDMNVSDDAKKFADIMDKAALRLGYKQPVITSGLRLSDRQISAMFDIWKREGSKFLIKLYAVDCKSCNSKAGEIASKIASVWEENTKLIPNTMLKIMPKTLAGRLIEKAKEILEQYPEGISAHQTGEALDYGLISNVPDQINNLLDYIRNNNLAEFEEINETKLDNEGNHRPGSHKHVTIFNITDKGNALLSSEKDESK